MTTPLALSTVSLIAGAAARTAPASAAEVAPGPDAPAGGSADRRGAETPRTAASGAPRSAADCARDEDFYPLDLDPARADEAGWIFDGPGMSAFGTPNRSGPFGGRTGRQGGPIDGTESDRRVAGRRRSDVVFGGVFAAAPGDGPTDRSLRDVTPSPRTAERRGRARAV